MIYPQGMIRVVKEAEQQYGGKDAATFGSQIARHDATDPFGRTEGAVLPTKRWTRCPCHIQIPLRARSGNIPSCKNGRIVKAIASGA
ncbi:hypothetical protein GCM10007973_07620 [Polymorphobacter multimanifer]|nr:hypothetical protein GCM10007973_07620 [Polymorphobacter multimanifer]